jgi:hypothetical protein
MIIYCIENLVNGKKYIGQSIQYNSEEDFQKSKYWGGGIVIAKAIEKYGKENFKKWIMIKDIPYTVKGFDELNRYEKLWIKKLNTKSPNGYNLNDGGQGNHKPCEETRKLMSKAASKRMNNRTIDEKNKQINNTLKTIYSKSKKELNDIYKRRSNSQKENWKNKNENEKKCQIEKHRIGLLEFYKKNPGFRKGICVGEKNGMFGKYHTEETKKLMKKSAKNAIRTYKEIYCIICNKLFTKTNNRQIYCFECLINKKTRGFKHKKIGEN